MASKLQQPTDSSALASKGIETKGVEKKHASTPLETIVDQIRRDSKTASDAYIDETKVPHGGE